MVTYGLSETFFALNKQQIALILSFVKAGEDSMMYLVAVNMLSK